MVSKAPSSGIATSYGYSSDTCSRNPPYCSKNPFGVSPFRNGSMKAMSRSTCVITAVCEVAGSTARREAGQRLSHVAHDAAAEEPEHRHQMLERRRVGIAGDDQHGRLDRLHVLLPGHRLLLELDQLFDDRRKAVRDRRERAGLLA